MRVSESLKATLRQFEGMLILFPFVVLSTASITFICHGHCAVWQFWFSLAVTFAVCLSGKGFMAFPEAELRNRLFAVGLFVSYLGLMWMLIPCFGRTALDYLGYHLPQVRLFMMGWNPIYENSIQEAAIYAPGFSEEWVQSFHVVFMAHSIELFDAVINLFVRTPYHGIQFALYWFVFPVTGAYVFRDFKVLFPNMTGKAHFLMMLLVVGTLVTQYFYLPSDCIFACASLCLLTGMARIIVADEDKWRSLLLSSLWAVLSKQIAIYYISIFWVVFGVILCILNKTAISYIVKKFLAYATIIIGSYIALASSPMISNIVRYKHPLYPQYTMDETVYPSVDLTGGDFSGNADFQRMGRFGRFVYAYLSPKLVKMYYEKVCDVVDFNPSCGAWYGLQTPLKASTRYVLLASFVVLSIFSRKNIAWRVILIFLFVGTLATTPSSMYGYLRYTPFVDLFIPFSILAIIVQLQNRRILQRTVLIGTNLLVIGNMFIILGYSLDSMWTLHKTLTEEGVISIAFGRETTMRTYAYYDTYLFTRQLLDMKGVEIKPMCLTAAIINNYHKVWSHNLYVQGNEPIESWRWSGFGKIYENYKYDRNARLLRYVVAVISCYFKTFPQLIWVRLTGII